MSVLVKLPRTVSGEELSDAIEVAGGKIGWITLRNKEICYEPGSVKAKELQSTLSITRPKKIKEGGFLNKLLGRPKEAKIETKPSFTSFDIVVPAEQEFNSVEFKTSVEVSFVNVDDVFDCVCGPKAVKTNDPRFVREIQPAFEQFLAYLFEILNRKSVAV